MNLILDVSSLLYRVFYMNKVRSNDSGIGEFNTFVFLRSLKSYLDMFKADKLYCAWDVQHLEHKNIRYELLEDTYKDGRKKEDQANVHKSDGILLEFLKTLGAVNIFPNILEADDVIYFLTKTLTNNTIISTDNDLLQLVDNNTQHYNPIKKQVININNFEEFIKVPMDKFLFKKCMTGDKSDNINGLPKFGKAKIQKVLDGLITLTEEQNQLVEKNRKIMDLSYCNSLYPEEVKLYNSQLISNKFDREKFLDLCFKYNFQSVMDQFSKWETVFNRLNQKNTLISLLAA